MSEYFGYMLRVNLDNEKIEKFIVNELILKKFVGGTGLGIKFLYDEVTPGIEWNSPENRLIFAAGPLNATPINGSGSVSVISKGPLTNGAGTSQANGFFGAYLRLCGLFGIIFQGRTNGLKYLYIDLETAELKDADWLTGMNTYRTTDAIKERHGCKERQMCVASIGPAGENLVKFAGIFFDYGHSASHNGLGAVMGSKRLKAIAIKPGKNKVPIKDIKRINGIAKKLLDNVKTQYREMYEYGTLTGIHNNAKVFQLPVKNYTTSAWNIPEDKWIKFSGDYIRKTFSLKRNNCWTCQLHHCYIMKITEGPYSGEILEEPEYEQLAAWSSNIGNDDVTGAMILSKDVDCLGLETNEAGWVIGFAMECYQKGILTKEILDGIELNWGNVEGVRRLLEMIVNRKGFGDILAEGVMRAAKKIGGEAENLAIHTLKGNTPRGHDHRNRWTEQFDTCVSNTGTLETWGMSPIGPT
ncbi:MAG: aldehyde ferredoxin oxidoreductase N-terminal domain-containing protein, partial [Nitrososphaeria archaeon]